MNIQINTKDKTIQFISEFTFKDLNDLKKFIPDIENWKIVPYSKINTVTIKDNWSSDPKYPFKGWQLRTGSPTMPNIEIEQTINSEKAKGIAMTYTKAEQRRKDFMLKGVNREPIEEFTNYNNKPEY